MTYEKVIQNIFSVILGLFFINVGVQHFLDPKWFEPIVPDIIGNPKFWVFLTGGIEVLLGVGLIIPNTRRYSGISMALFLVAVYWANLNMWINDIPLDGKTYASKWHILRGIAQTLMIAIALWVGGWLKRAKTSATN